MCNAIYFDMDGTIANLYSVNNWEYKLNHEDVTPYKEATPLHDMQVINSIMYQLKGLGVTIGVISWLAMHSTKEYNKATRKAKREWLKEFLPSADEIHLVKYGTPKHYVNKIKENAILIDDNESVRNKWKGNTIDPTCEDFVKKLEEILQNKLQEFNI